MGSIVMNLSQASGSMCSGSAANPASLSDGSQLGFNFTCSDAASASVGDRFKAEITFTYTATGESLSHTMTGDITTKVE